MNAVGQLELAANLSKLWKGLLPESEVPTQAQFLRWAGFAPEWMLVDSINRAARKMRDERSADRIGRYVSGILRNRVRGLESYNTAPTTITHVRSTARR